MPVISNLVSRAVQLCASRWPDVREIEWREIQFQQLTQIFMNLAFISSGFYYRILVTQLQTISKIRRCVDVMLCSILAE
jgi:hypothetical protein